MYECDELLDESTKCSWNNFGRLLGKFTIVPDFLRVWMMPLTVFHSSPEALEMAL